MESGKKAKQEIVRLVDNFYGTNISNSKVETRASRINDTTIYTKDRNKVLENQKRRNNERYQQTKKFLSN